MAWKRQSAAPRQSPQKRSLPGIRRYRPPLCSNRVLARKPAPAGARVPKAGWSDKEIFIGEVFLSSDNSRYTLCSGGYTLLKELDEAAVLRAGKIVLFLDGTDHKAEF
jgi:hypothetical protein